MSVTENPEATEKAQEIVPGKSPTETSKVSSEQPKTFTQEQLDMAVHQAKSEAGRATVSLAEAERILTDAKRISSETLTEREQWQKERDEADREAVSSDPEALKSFNEKIRQRDKDAELTERERVQKESEDSHKTKVADDLETIRVFNRTQLAAEVAVAKGVDIGTILELAKDDTREAMEAIANRFKEAKPPLKTDSSTTIGGGATFEQIRDAMIKNPSNDALMRRYIEAKAEKDKNK